MWFGPFIRYTQIVQTEEDGTYDNRDARILVVGLSLSLVVQIFQESIWNAYAQRVK